jgi:hypothetical protein
MTDGAVRERWTLTQEAFDKLLLSFGNDRDSGGQKYLEIRSNLTRFFEWRGCPFPEDHADETINRMVADLKSEKLITQYLLCNLPEDQQVEIEDPAFSDVNSWLT